MLSQACQKDGRVLDVSNVVWCTGFDAAMSWIDLPVFGADGLPQHEARVGAAEPGLFFVGLPFLYAFSSEMIHGVGRADRGRGCQPKEHRDRHREVIIGSYRMRGSNDLLLDGDAVAEAAFSLSR